MMTLVEQRIRSEYYDNIIHEAIVDTLQLELWENVHKFVEHKPFHKVAERTNVEIDMVDVINSDIIDYLKIPLDFNHP